MGPAVGWDMLEPPWDGFYGPPDFTEKAVLTPGFPALGDGSTGLSCRRSMVSMTFWRSSGTASGTSVGCGWVVVSERDGVVWVIG